MVSFRLQHWTVYFTCRGLGNGAGAGADQRELQAPVHKGEKAALPEESRGLATRATNDLDLSMQNFNHDSAVLRMQERAKLRTFITFQIGDGTSVFLGHA